MKPDYDFYSKMLQTALSAGLPIISTDTAAKVLAITYVYGGNNELFIASPKLKADLKYIQDRFHINGGEAPSVEIVPLIQQYVHEFQTYLKGKHKEDFPDWADKLMKDRYGIKLM